MIRKHKRVLLMLVPWLLSWGCSSETWKRTGYETLQNLHQQGCQEEIASGCGERESYSDYEQRREEALKDR